jgi:hypothetical protein
LIEMTPASVMSVHFSASNSPRRQPIPGLRHAVQERGNVLGAHADDLGCRHLRSLDGSGGIPSDALPLDGLTERLV